MPDGFPPDDYTPHGYLHNRYANADAPEGPAQYRSLAPIGYEWRLTGHPDESRRGGLRVGLRVGNRRLFSSADFDRERVAPVSRYHTSRAQSFDFAWRGLTFEATYFVAARDVLACRVRLSGRNDEPFALVVSVATGDTNTPACDGSTFLVSTGDWFALATGETMPLTSPLPPGGRGVGGVRSDERWLALARCDSPDSALASARAALADAPRALAERFAEDDAFWSRAPRLAGDWPAAWRRGWIYDLETTRLVVFPQAGVFAGPWPSWMLNHPRAVLAESTLDVLRLALADPDLAWTAIETVLATAERIGAAQVPCVLPNGEPDMVAADGSVCGTSPAWCLPFHNLRLLYRLSPDRARLARLYPRIAAYAEWWLANRADADGWIGYRCSWESGEDESPRLDPQRQGDRVIQGEVRPVELQAAMAQCATVLAFFARELGRGSVEVARWESLREAYVARTRRMWDDNLRQFGDHDARGRPLRRTAEYWGKTVACDALQLIPLLDGIARPEQTEVLASRLDEFDAPPWALWPSWSWTVAEAARAVGRHDLAGRMSASIIERVYRENDRRVAPCHGRPLPGVAREYWPLDLAEFRGNEAYGWGANTLHHLLRHVLGFGPGSVTDRPSFELAPYLPAELEVAGREYRVENLRFRGSRLDICLRPLSADETEVRIAASHGGSWRVADSSGSQIECRQIDEKRIGFVAHSGILYVVDQSDDAQFADGGCQ